MTRTMGDSVDVNLIPKNIDLVATYVSGHLGIVPPIILEALFPSDDYVHIFIDAIGTRPDAHVRDWETGDKAGSLEQWVIAHNKDTGKKDAVIYCNKSTIAEVRRLTGSQVLGVDYWLWIATLDDTVYTAPGVIACQSRGVAQNVSNFDTSVVFDSPPIWPFLAVKVVPPPATTKPDCTAFQRAIRVGVDNMWGQLTDNAANALIAAWSDEFPEGVVFAQFTVGTRGDGVWGPNSKQAMHDTTAHVQRALIAMGYNPGTVDGLWGPHTNEAYMAARKACHI